MTNQPNDQSPNGLRPAPGWPELRRVLTLFVLGMAFGGVACSDETPDASDTAVFDAVANDVPADDASTSDTPPTDVGQTDAEEDQSDATVDIIVDAEPIGPNTGESDVDLESVSGLRIEQTTYTVPGVETERTLDLHIWYPTEDEEGEGTIFTIVRDAFAWENATLAPATDSQPAPLVIYSHGGLGFAGQISTVARQFVRNGWIFVAVPHPGDNLFDSTESKPYAFTVVRGFDSIAALDYLENLPDEHDLSGRLDTSNVLAMGHSFGGQNSWLLAGLTLNLERIRERCGEDCTDGDITAYETFAPDARVSAAISMESLLDSNLYEDESFVEMGAPVLHMSGSEANDATELFARLSAANLTWVSLVGGCHESFTGTLVCATLELEESLHATAVYTLAFGARHILGSEDPAVLGILDGSTQVSESAELMRAGGVD